MLFSSITFLYYFLVVLLLVYFFSPKKYRNFILLVFSLLFYFLGEPKYIVILILSGVLNYFFGNMVLLKHKKFFLVVACIYNIGLLLFFKYTDFFITNINSLLGSNISLLYIVMPIGISFFTFQALSYVIDIYNGKSKPANSLIDFMTYLSLFPQLVAGPIVRYNDVFKELVSREVNYDNFSYGVSRFIIGLSKKVLLANVLGEFVGNLVDVNFLSSWLKPILFTLQIYFDFSGYSDMAIGLGKMFGFSFLENFNYPLISSSITDFWRRWHISLSSWFRDYVYIPLGGNRKGTIILVRNIFIVWALTGIWHGANWTFVIWGLMYGIMLIIEKLFLTKHLEKMPSILQRIYVLFTVMISFIIFNANSIGEAWNNIIGLFGANGESLINASTVYYLKSYLVVLVIAIIGSTPLLKNIIEKLKTKTNANKIINLLEPIAMASILIIVTAYLVDNSYNPFLYFRF